jgi:signal transduction histidine kinase
MNHFAISTLITAISTFLLGLFILGRDVKSRVYRSFAFYSFSITAWGGCVALHGFTTVESTSLLAARLLHIGAALIPVTLIHFVFVFIDGSIYGIRKKILQILYFVALFFILLSFTPVFVNKVSPRYNVPFLMHPGGVWYHVFVFYFVMLISYGLYKMFIEYISSSGVRHNQMKYLFWSSLLGYMGGVDNFLIIYDVCIFPLYPYGTYAVPVYVIVTSYAIVRYRLMDITVALTRAGIFAVVYALVLGIPFGVGAMFPEFGWAAPLFLMAILASAGPFIYMKIQKRVESRLRMEEFRSHRELRRLAHNMLRFTDLERLLSLIVHHLVKIMKLKFAAVYLSDEMGDRYALKSFWQPGGQVDLPGAFLKDSPLVKDFNLRRLPIVTEELKLFGSTNTSPRLKELADTLLALKVNIVIPAFLHRSLFGFLVLSNKRTNLSFSQEDLNLLMVLSNTAALAIENAQFYQKERSVLVEKSRREALADMAPGASHQFNNRLVAISSSVELLLLKLENLKPNNSVDKSTEAFLEDTKNTLELIDQEVYKGKEITSAILKRSKTKTDFQKLDILKLLKNTYSLVLIGHSKPGSPKRFKEPAFDITYSDQIPNIYANEALLQDSFYNLFDNACDAIGEKFTFISQGSLRIKEGLSFKGKIEVVLKKQGQILVIQVKDNGMGLKEENKRKLFTPYFTTKASSGKGSGLGLYVIRDFIEMHNGTISYDSEYTAGTTFSIRLPINKRSRR